MALVTAPRGKFTMDPGGAIIANRLTKAKIEETQFRSEILKHEAIRLETENDFLEARLKDADRTRDLENIGKELDIEKARIGVTIDKELQDARIGTGIRGLKAGAEQLEADVKGTKATTEETTARTAGLGASADLARAGAIRATALAGQADVQAAATAATSRQTSVDRLIENFINPDMKREEIREYLVNNIEEVKGWAGPGAKGWESMVVDGPLFTKVYQMMVGRLHVEQQEQQVLEAKILEEQNRSASLAANLASQTDVRERAQVLDEERFAHEKEEDKREYVRQLEKTGIEQTDANLAWIAEGKHLSDMDMITYKSITEREVEARNKVKIYNELLKSKPEMAEEYYGTAEEDLRKVIEEGQRFRDDHQMLTFVEDNDEVKLFEFAKENPRGAPYVSHGKGNPRSDNFVPRGTVRFSPPIVRPEDYKAFISTHEPGTPFFTPTGKLYQVPSRQQSPGPPTRQQSELGNPGILQDTPSPRRREPTSATRSP